VTVAAGQTTSPYFTINTVAVTAATAVTISAQTNGTTRSATFTVRPPALLSVALQTTQITGGATLTNNRVNLDGPAPAGGALVTLSSSQPGAAAAPASVLVPAGATASDLFTITTAPVAADTPAVITAVYAGVTKQATLTVKAPAPAYLSISPASLKGGTSSPSSSVQLTGPAPAGGFSVALASTNPAAVPQSVVVVPAGAASAAFSITTSAVAANTVATISATANGVTKTGSLTVTP
jgi:hypothetical protein